jgi:hypothetical protein
MIFTINNRKFTQCILHSDFSTTGCNFTKTPLISEKLPSLSLSYSLLLRTDNTKLISPFELMFARVKICQRELCKSSVEKWWW